MTEYETLELARKGHSLCLELKNVLLELENYECLEPLEFITN